MSERKFRTGEAFRSIEEFEESLMERPVTITLTEEQRQLVILALAKLAMDRVGWVNALEEIALKMDNKLPDGKAEMFDKLLRIQSDHAAKVLAG